MEKKMEATILGYKGIIGYNPFITHHGSFQFLFHYPMGFVLRVCGGEFQRMGISLNPLIFVFLSCCHPSATGLPFTRLLFQSSRIFYNLVNAAAAPEKLMMRWVQLLKS